MDTLLPQLLAFPPRPPPVTPLTESEYDKQIRCVVQLLNQTPANKLAGGVSGGGDLLTVWQDPFESHLAFRASN